MKDRIKHAFSPLDAAIGDFTNTLNQFITVAFALGKN
jgi:hypothetical protein